MAEVVETKPVATESAASTVDSNAKLMAAIAWFFAPIASVVFIVLDNYKKDKYVQFHAWQSLAFGIANIVVSFVLGWTCILPLAMFVVAIVGIIKAFQGEMWKLPVIGDWAEQQANSTVASASK